MSARFQFHIVFAARRLSSVNSKTGSIAICFMHNSSVAAFPLIVIPVFCIDAGNVGIPESTVARKKRFIRKRLLAFMKNHYFQFEEFDIPIGIEEVKFPPFFWTVG